MNVAAAAAAVAAAAVVVAAAAVAAAAAVNFVAISSKKIASSSSFFPKKLIVLISVSLSLFAGESLGFFAKPSTKDAGNREWQKKKKSLRGIPPHSTLPILLKFCNCVSEQLYLLVRNLQSKN